MVWVQHYNPLGHTVLSTLVAAVPVTVLLVAIAFLRIRIHFAAVLGLAVALAVLMGPLVLGQAYVYPLTKMVVY